MTYCLAWVLIWLLIGLARVSPSSKLFVSLEWGEREGALTRMTRVAIFAEAMVLVGLQEMVPVTL